LRNALPNLRLQVNCGAGSIKSQFKKADKSGAAYALILGEDELDRGVISLKPLTGAGEQKELPISGLSDSIATLLKN
jgi:histidyl-tRNA synthetase